MTVRPALACALLSLVVFVAEAGAAPPPKPTDLPKAPPAASDTAPPPPSAPLPQISSPEVRDLRSATTKVFKAPNGQVAAIASGPIHHDVNGQWTEIDPTLVPSNDPEFAWENRSGSVSVRLSATASDDALVELIRDTVVFRYGLIGANPFSLGVVSENRITYGDIRPGVDLELEVTSSGVKETLILTRPPTEPLAFGFAVTLDGASLRQASHGALELVEPGGNIAFRLPRSWMVDSRGGRARGVRTESVVTSFSVAGARAEIRLQPSLEWLRDPARVYPVELDPTTWQYGATDTYVSDDSSGPHYASTEVLVGFRHFVDDGGGWYPPTSYTILNRGLIAFDVSNLAGKQILGATLYMGCGGGGNGGSINLYRNASPWAQDAMWNTQPATGEQLASVNPACPGWLAWPVTSAVANWVSGAWPNYGLQLRGSNEDPASAPCCLWEPWRFDASEVGLTGDMPHLYVNYNSYPHTPTECTPNGGVTGKRPTFSCGYNDPDSGDAGATHLEIWNATAPGTPSTYVRTGWGNVVQPGQRSSWTVPDDLPSGCYVWRAINWDENAYSSWTGWIDFCVNRPPTASAPEPVSGATGVSTAPTVSLVYTDADSQPGHVEYEFKQEDSQTPSTGIGSTVVSGARSSWAPPSPLSPATRYCWRGRPKDAFGEYGTWSAWFCFATAAAPLSTTGLGLERYYHYEGEDVGGGMQHLTNVASGNSLLRVTPFVAPGRGLSTVVDLTYNSQEGLSESPVGHGWSLSISTLTRVGSRLRDNSTYVDLVDGDGTLHRFIKTATGWQEPPGVHLYLRRTAAGWAATRPDGVTFHYDLDGYPTSVDDRNGNRLEFEYQQTPTNEILGSETKRLVSVKDDAGVKNGLPNRTFGIQYYPVSTASPAATGRVKRITDHSGSALDFEYDPNGILRAVVQRGGTNPDGSALADRRWAFGHASGTTRVTSVTDPRSNATSFAYYADGTIERRTNREAEATTFSYDAAARTSTAAAPLGRQTTYGWDAEGKVVTITEKTGASSSETTTLMWTNRHVTKVTEPSGRYVEYSYDDNGYVTGVWDQLRNHTQLEYQYVAVDAGDIPANGRTQPHISQLIRKTNPEGTATTDVPDDHQWKFEYDLRGNLEKVTDPLGNSTLITPNPDGTTQKVTDANNHSTTFEYDANGLPTKIVEPTAATTTIGYDDDGLVRWIQSPANQTENSANPRLYRSYFDYDSFHRLARQSAPKTVGAENLLWSGVKYDPNDNITIAYRSVLGTTFTQETATEFEYDDMDRVRRERAAPRDPNHTSSIQRVWRITEYTYDGAGRLEQVTLPKGVGTTDTTDFSTRYQYDLLDRVLAVTAHGAAGSTPRTTNYCYDLAGDLRSVTAPKAADPNFVCPATSAPDSYAYTGVTFTTRLAYDAAHRAIRVSDPEGRMTSVTYDRNGQTKTATDEQGSVRTFEYDPAGQLIKVVQPFERDAGGTVTRELVTKLEYDRVGNLVRKISPRAWDARTDEQTFPYYTTSHEYDSVGRLVRTKLPVGPGEEQAYVHRAYDLNGNLSWASLPVLQPDPAQVPAGKKTVLSYFEPGWVKTTDVPDRPRVHFEYTPEGWQSMRTPENGSGELVLTRRMSWEYFTDGLLKKRIERGGGAATYEYDLHGNLSLAEDGTGPTNGVATEFEADWNGFDEPSVVRDRLIGETGWRTTTYDYDLNGNVRERVDQGRRHEFSYDQTDWLKTQVDYDPAGQLERQITTDYLETGWQKLRSVERRVSGAWELRQKTLWDYFANGKLKTLETQKGNGTTLEQHTVSYFDANDDYVNGHRTSDVFVLAGPRAQDNCKTEARRCRLTYAYDGRGRLVREERTTRVSDTQWDSDYELKHTLDPAGNVTRTLRSGEGAHDTTYAYAGNRLVERTRIKSGTTKVQEYWYDGVGNLDCVTRAAGSQADCNGSGSLPANVVADYTYDALDRLTRSRDQERKDVAAIHEATYEYDALNRPVKVNETHSGSSRETILAYLGLSSLVTDEKASYNGETTPSVSKAYSYDPYGTRIGMEDKRAGVAKDYTFAYDVHGSVSMLLDQAGGVAASYGYTAYGEDDAGLTRETDRAGNATDPTDPLNPYRYTGKRMDTGSDTLDMGARRFSPDIGRFLQEDFYGDALGDLGLGLDPLTQNRYSLAGGNPVSFVEVDGHCVAGDGTGSAHHASTQARPPGCTPGAADVDRAERNRRAGDHDNAGSDKKYAAAANRKQATKADRSATKWTEPRPCGTPSGARMACSQAWPKPQGGGNCVGLCGVITDWAPGISELKAFAQCVEEPGFAYCATAVPGAGRIVRVVRGGKTIVRKLADETGPMAGKRLGHTFSRHGSSNTDELLQRAAGSGQPQGQWLDEAAAERLIADHLDDLRHGAITIDLPPGVGRIIHPDGTFTSATKARLVPSRSGVKTAYPEYVG
jgi:RHS repeat-associated protein